MSLDKKIIVTGGTYGMGSNIVRGLVRERAVVSSMARSADIGERLAKELTAEGPGRATFYRCDVSVRAEVELAFAAAVEDMGGLDVLVHVAGVEHHAALEEESDEDWDRVFAINARGTFITNQVAFRYFKDRGGGRIINFGSGSGVVGMDHNGAYSASKGAVAAWTRSAAMAWGKHDITVNCVCPAVWTPMYEAHRAAFTPEQLQAHDEHIARIVRVGGVLGDPDRDLVPAVLFLCSDGARFITGQILPVDGGALMVR
jgi:NAD(P)-dependent dehydrogenase (short-subunit alcohol dehydrogenase family)